MVDPRPITRATASGGSAPQWELFVAQPFLYPAHTTALDGALRQINLDPSTLLRGAYDSFRTQAGVLGKHYAVPVFAVPWGAQYDGAVFMSAVT